MQLLKLIVFSFFSFAYLTGMQNTTAPLPTDSLLLRIYTLPKEMRQIIFLALLNAKINAAEFLPQLQDIVILAKNFGLITRTKESKWIDNPNEELFPKLRLKQLSLLSKIDNQLKANGITSYNIINKGIDALDTYRSTALVDAASLGNLNLVKLLINNGATTNRLAAEEYAQKNSHYEIVVFLRNSKKRKRGTHYQ